MRSTLEHALLTAALFSTKTTLAQNSTINSTSTCPGIGDQSQCCPSFLGLDYISPSNTSVVSTGSVSFNPTIDSNEWILSILVDDTGSSNSGRNRYTRESFLSVSNNTPNTSVAIYQLSPVNATKSSDGASCAGVFSDECTAFIQQAVFNATNAEWRPGDNPYADPLFSNPDPRLSELCGNVLTPNEMAYSVERFLVPNDNCSYPSLPGIDLPDDYQTPAAGSSKYFYKAEGYQSGYSNIIPASTYDQFVSQVIPFAIVTSLAEGNQNNAVEIVCVTPNNTRAGAPAISDGTPWEESAGVSLAMGSGIVVMLAGLVGSMLA